MKQFPEYIVKLEDTHTQTTEKNMAQPVCNACCHLCKKKGLENKRLMNRLIAKQVDM